MRKKRVKQLKLQAIDENKDLKEGKIEYLNRNKPLGKSFDQKSFNSRMKRKKARDKNKKNDKK